MVKCDWKWNADERINLDDCPTDSWQEAYHWLDNQVTGEVVVKVSETNEMIGYICDVEE